MVLQNNIRDPEIIGYIRKLLLMAMGFFVFTTAIGLINVLDFADEFLYEKRGLILFHLHSGTIAWISTGIVCTMMWAFAQNRTDTDHLKKMFHPFYKFWQIVIPSYAIVILLSFQFEFYWFLPVFAALTIGGFLWGSYLAYLEKDKVEVFGVPHLSFILGLAVAGYAGFIGALLGLQYAFNVTLVNRGISAHAGGMEIGYVFVVLTGITELVLMGDDLKTISKFSALQPIILTVSGIFVSLGELLGVRTLVQLSLPLEIIGVLIFLFRMLPVIVRTSNLRHPSDRFFVFVPIYLLVAVSLFIFVLVAFIIPENFDDPYVFEVFKALNHSELVGAASGTLFGIITAFSMGNREGNMEWADIVGITLLYLGLTGFIMGFLLEFALHSAILMGTGILILITAYFKRLT